MISVGFAAVPGSEHPHLVEHQLGLKAADVLGLIVVPGVRRLRGQTARVILQEQRRFPVSNIGACQFDDRINVAVHDE